MELSKFNSETKYSSLYLVEQINFYRDIEGNRSELLHKNLLTKIEKEFEEEINGLNILLVEYLDKKGENRKMYELNFEQSLQILMSESKSVRKAVIATMKNQQAKIQELQKQELKQLPQTYKEALLALVQAEEEKEQLLLTNENLSAALDVLVEWVSIIKVAKANKVKETVFKWQVLKNKSIEMGFAIKKAESPRFGYQNLYNINVFKACYPQFNYNFLN